MAPPRFDTVDVGELGSFLAFTAAEQHQLWRTWIARDAGGQIVRVLSDAGLIELDLASEPAPPWSQLSA